jgi:hypothetical protein
MAELVPITKRMHDEADVFFKDDPAKSLSTFEGMWHALLNAASEKFAQLLIRERAITYLQEAQAKGEEPSSDVAPSKEELEEVYSQSVSEIAKRTNDIRQIYTQNGIEALRKRETT